MKIILVIFFIGIVCICLCCVTILFVGSYGASQLFSLANNEAKEVFCKLVNLDVEDKFFEDKLKDIFHPKVSSSIDSAKLKEFILYIRKEVFLNEECVEAYPVFGLQNIFNVSISSTFSSQFEGLWYLTFIKNDREVSFQVVKDNNRFYISYLNL